MGEWTEDFSDYLANGEETQLGGLLDFNFSRRRVRPGLSGSGENDDEVTPVIAVRAVDVPDPELRV